MKELSFRNNYHRDLFALTAQLKVVKLLVEIIRL